MGMDSTSTSQPLPAPEETEQSTAVVAPSPVEAPNTGVKPDESHYSALAQMFAEVSQDHAHLRTFVYEFARIKLRKELYPRFVEGAWNEIEVQMRGLEAAIDRIEADFAQDAPLLPHAPQLLRLSDLSQDRLPPESPVPRFGMGGTTRFGEEGIRAQPLLAPSPVYRANPSSTPAVSVGRDRFDDAHSGRRRRSRAWRNVQLIAAVAIGVAIYAASDATTILNKVGLHWLDEPTKSTPMTGKAQEPEVAAVDSASQGQRNEARRRHVGDIPVPTEYGAYAVVNGQLVELEQLAIKVPDPRVAISAAFSTPSRAHLPASPREFVIFKRDLLNSAPDRVAVRIVAQVMRALSFDATGNAKNSPVEESWVIRNNSYPMRVGPLADNPEMVVIRSETPGFVLSAGRYALVLKGVGYDFTIDGPLTDPAHCLERTEALNAPIYSECPKT
jgi:hypothetical protein